LETKPTDLWLLDALSCSDGGLVRRNEPLRRHCTWRIGGPADLWIEPRSVGQLARICRILSGTSVPKVIMGNGSNLLFDDAGVRGAVIVMGRNLARVSIRGRTVTVEAGIAMPRLARLVGLSGLTGLEHTVGIPGTLGGLIAMNGGSLRRSIGSVVRSVSVVDSKGEISSLPQADCGFGYRCSRFLSEDAIIVGAELELDFGDPLAIRRDMLEILRDRRDMFPRRLPNCGSVFHSNPVADETFGPTGRVIEQTGCKGWRIGDAEVSRQHANFIVNRGTASASDVLALIAKVRRAVHARTGRWLRCEVRYVSPQGKVMPAHEAPELVPGPHDRSGPFPDAMPAAFVTTA